MNKTYRAIIAGWDDNGDLTLGQLMKGAENFMAPRADFLSPDHDDSLPRLITFSYLRVEAADWKGAAEAVARQWFDSFPPENDCVLSLPRMWVERDPSGVAKWDRVADLEFDADGEMEVVIPEGYIPESYREVRGVDLPMELMEISDSAYLDYDFLDSLHSPHAVLTLGAAALSYVTIYWKAWERRNEVSPVGLGEMMYLMTGDTMDLDRWGLLRLDRVIERSDVTRLFTDEERATFDEHRRSVEAGWKWRMRYNGYGDDDQC